MSTPRKLDGRYAVALEYCGYAEPRYVARFCGVWHGQHATRRLAVRTLRKLHAERMNAIRGVIRP